MTTESTKNKHMTLDQRIEIQVGLEKRYTIKRIADTIDKDPTTVSKEIKKHTFIKPIPNGNDEADEIHFDPETGEIIENPLCPKLKKSPYVCNGCEKHKRRCGYQKQFYYAKNAQNDYKAELVDARVGIPLTKKEFYEMDKIISDGLKKGQHLYQIISSNDFNASEASIYRYFHKGYMSANKFELPRMVKFKQRRKNQTARIPSETKKGRMYDDFKAFVAKYQLTTWVEMDTVIGRPGGKVIMTFNFNFCNFIFGILLEDKTALSAANGITALKEVFRASGKKFSDVIPLLLTDNGTEFANVWAFIDDLDGDPETDLFFCDPNQSQQKARVEKNHTLFRDIVPKGESFDDFTQETVNLIFSHINSVNRKALNGKTSYDLFTFTFDSETASLLGISQIPKDKVIQSPLLISNI